jgi:hypothetical protein
MLALRVAIATLALVVGSAIGVAGQGEEASPSASAPPILESPRPAPTWLDEQTCIDSDFMLAKSASGNSRGDMFSCARALGLRKRDADYDTYDFRLWKGSFERERWTSQCDDAGNHIGSRYHASGTDRLYNIEEKKRAVVGSFDFSVVSTLIDPDEDIWQVEKQGVLWDVHATDGEWSWAWSVDSTAVSKGTPEEPRLTQYRGVEPSAFQKALCDYLK